MILAHKIRIYPRPEQEIILNKSCGISRYTYNWALDRSKKIYEETGKSISMNELKKIWNQEKPDWVYEAPKDANQQPFSNLSTAYSRFFKKQSSFPVYHKKGRNDSFYMSNDRFKIDNRYIKLNKIGLIRMAECLRFDGKIMSVTISKKTNLWFASIMVDVGDYYKQCGDEIIGVDLGIKSLATLSNGEIIPNQKPLKKKLKRLKKLQRKHSKKVKGSNNRKKSAIKLSRMHYKISCQRHDVLNKLTTYLCSKAKTLVIEDLNVSGMMKNHKLAQSISDCGFYEFRRQLEYKCKIYGVDLIVVDRFFPSSKTCNRCGCIKEDLKLSDRIYKCDCGHEIDRDLNAALNLKNYPRLLGK